MRLRHLYRELTLLQEQIIHSHKKLLIIVEGLDASGKSSALQKIQRHLNPKYSRVVRLSTPTEHERSQWYFQRYVPHLPAAKEIVLFDRSWYNRAGLEKVMGFATEQEVEGFYRDVLPFEELLKHAGIILCKFFLSISQAEQQRRIERRLRDLSRPFRVTPLDREAVARYDDYQRAAQEMFQRAPSWVVIEHDKKRDSRRALLSELLAQINPR